MLLKRLRRCLLAVICLTLFTVSYREVPKAFCANCPEAHLTEGNYIKCLAGQSAKCESGPKCECQGLVRKDNECGGGCGVRTNWGACTIECPKGVNATCKQGSKRWLGLEQIIEKPRCECGGSGSVSAIPSTKEKDGSLGTLSDTLIE